MPLMLMLAPLRSFTLETPPNMGSSGLAVPVKRVDGPTMKNLARCLEGGADVMYTDNTC